MHSIKTLDNSKWVKDYHKYFHISRDYGDSSKISNTELADQIFASIFTSINSIIVVFPSQDGKIYKDISYKISEEDEGKRDEIKGLLKPDKVKFHSSELHNLDIDVNCREHVHYFKFSDYSEIVKFLGYIQPDQDVKLKVYTTLVNENEKKTEPMTVHNIDNSVHNVDNSTHKTTNIDKSTNVEINSRGNFSKPRVEINGKKEKSWWNKLIGFLGKLIGKSN